MHPAGVTPGGVPGLGDVAWGSHFCHFYQTGDDLADTLVPFFKAGLDHHEACLWVTSEPFPARTARAALAAVVPDLASREARGQIEIVDHDEWYLRAGRQESAQALDGWIEHERRALESGYAGLRLTGNTFWLEREGWRSFVEYEALVNQRFGHHRIVGLCSYSLDRCTPSDVIDVVRNHHFAVARRDDAWEVIESAAVRAAREDLVRLQASMQREREITSRLRDAELRYQDSDRRKDEFLAILGHELRNPLAPIVTALQVLRLRGADVEFRREHEIIERQVRHLTALVDDLLDVSRITRGRIVLDARPMELAEAVLTGIETASPLLEQRHQRLDVDVPRGLVVRGEHRRLAQVVANLLSNAAKHTPEGGEIALTAARGPGTIVLRVRDTGEGIAPELLPKVFELFVQGEQPLDRAQGGLGLGLAIVRSLVELHGGTIEIESTLGRGTTFTMTLPAIEGVLPARVEHCGAVALGARARRRVLIVDDNADAARPRRPTTARARSRWRSSFRRRWRSSTSAFP
jgi:signal transduction histidine kinase